MADTLITIASAVLSRLGDSAEEVWSLAEIRGYLREGYDRMAIQARMFWEMDYLEDRPMVANLTAEWEREFLQAGWQETGIAMFSSPADIDFVPEGMHALGPRTHNHIWESAYVTTEFYQAVHDLPADCYEIERATWNSRRLDALRSTDLEGVDARYELDNGDPVGYLRDKDGLNKFRKYKIPSSAADEYTVTGHWGIARDISDVSDEENIGTWGIPRLIPGEHPIRGPWGFPRRFYKDGHNTRIEFFRRGSKPVLDGDEFELPQRYVKYLRHYAQGRALDHEGPGQDRPLAAIYLGLFDAGIERAQRRSQAMNQNRRLELGGDMREEGRPPLARMPWNYGPAVGRPPIV